MISLIVMALLGFGTGGLVGKYFASGFYPAAWVGLAIGIVLWLAIKIAGGGAADGIGDAFDGFGFDDD